MKGDDAGHAKYETARDAAYFGCCCGVLMVILGGLVVSGSELTSSIYVVSSWVPIMVLYWFSMGRLAG